MCLKNAAGDQGGVRQGGQDSNDMMVPLKRNHANYNGIPSRNNIFRAKDNWITPCAKCKYAKSCFLEVGVAECPSGFHKMYTGYMFGGHETHHGNNDRFCMDKNPANNDCKGLNLAGPCCAKLVAPAVAASPLAIAQPTRVWLRTHTLSRIPARAAALALLYLPDTSNTNWNGYVYPTIARDGTGNGLSRNGKVVLACHQCCVH